MSDDDSILTKPPHRGLGPLSRRRLWSRGTKSFLPRGLFGRSVLLLAAPIIVSLLVGTWVFYDRFFSTVMRRLSNGVAANIALVIDDPSFRDLDAGSVQFLGKAAQRTGLHFRYAPGATLSPRDPPDAFDPIARYLEVALTGKGIENFTIEANGFMPSFVVHLQMPRGVLDVMVPRDSINTPVTYVFLLWMIATGLITLVIATLILRNQVRSLRRLAQAAEAIGKGRDVPNFKPEGATEVRQAAAAFLVMRERIQRQITQRTEMLAGVSHDLRTPLTRMKLELELLGESQEIEELKSDVTEMQQMVEGYLSFARGEGNEAPQVVDLVGLLNDSANTMRRGGTEISLSMPAELHVPVRRDAIRRCIMNLLSNSARYGGQIWVIVLRTQPIVEIAIDDDGPGIPEALREAVFRPFYRLESSRNVSTGGVGLGLTIARDILRGHGGDLILKTSPQGGLRAIVTLPR